MHIAVNIKVVYLTYVYIVFMYIDDCHRFLVLVDGRFYRYTIRVSRKCVYYNNPVIFRCFVLYSLILTDIVLLPGYYGIDMDLYI